MTSELPGPGLELPVDADGDGISTFGDRYAFNYWLELGGDLETALAAAEVGETTIDLTDFFKSTDAQLKPQASEMQVQTSSSGSGYTGCPPSGVIDDDFSAPEMPASLFESCENKFRFPTGCAVDGDQGLWCSRGHPGENVNDKGVVRLLDLLLAPPRDEDGSIPRDSPVISEALGFVAEDMVVRETPPGGTTGCPGREIHAMSTWPGGNLPGADFICRVAVKVPPDESLCEAACSEIAPNSQVVPSTDPPINDPFALDAYRDGMPPAFENPDPEAEDIAPEDLVFSDKAGAVRIRRAMSPDKCSPSNSVVTTIHTFGSGVTKVWGLALGDFNGAGDFGAYIVVEENGERDVRRVNPDNSVVNFVMTLPAGNTARTIEFDPVSGDLFVSEDAEQGRIWRIDETGTVRLFGTNFKQPNGITFFPTGVMLVAEVAEVCEENLSMSTGNVLVVGGWRNEFKRGDANGDGTVNLSDACTIFDWANKTAPPPKCFDGADANDDSKVNNADGDFIINFLFFGGPPPPAPGPFECGKDPTRDLLDCITSDPACAIE